MGDVPYTEDDLLPLSGLQHLLFCERQCALIHIEQLWAENRLTAEGRILHERVHETDSETRGNVRIARGVRIRSLTLGLIGQADVVEFRRDDEGQDRPCPVEYKRGRPKPDQSDTVQLCAQAICLEEMLGVSIPHGAIFYGQPRRRMDVAFTPELRRTTEETAGRLHALIKSARTPPAVYEKKCNACSLYDICKPKSIGYQRSAVAYLKRMTVE